ncbi:MAG: type restriction protein res subunit [Hydrocarboniphaga sp.]|nr:type restriction protein res subunit [Hydrocarboniphaga sp.]
MAAERAEAFAHPDPRAACFYARRALELAIRWLFEHDRELKLPYKDDLSALIHEPTFKQAVGPALFTKVDLIRRYGNQAVHSSKPVMSGDAVVVVRELFHFGYWLARTYARGQKPADGVRFDGDGLPKTSPVPPQTLAALQQLNESLAEKDARLSELLTGHAVLNAELERLRAEVAAAKQLNAAVPDTHDYSEAETRDQFIDLLLREAGWALDQKRDREYEVGGMPNMQGQGFVDYVLWGDDGKPLAVVEAKRTRKSPGAGQQQAKLYADCLEQQFGQRPVIFYTNAYEHWLWDDTEHPPRPVQGFYKKDELLLLVQRRSTRLPLGAAEISPSIVERYYQHRAIRRIAESFEQDHDRKALVVMATGAGKTRTVVALCDLLMRCNWVKRVLFLADRVALVNQTVKVFSQQLPASSPVNLVTEKNTQGRVYVSTYPTMMGLIDAQLDGQRRFGVGHFDLIVIDEAHRSVYQKYRAIFDYFDCLLVGLTATPREEIDRNTYGLFGLESGVPTDVYSLDEAVNDKFLVPPQTISVPLRFQREGIRYEQLTEAEKDAWDALEWDEETGVPDRVEAEAVNKWLFNKDTVDKVLEHLMVRGQKVADGDRLGKTIIFAKNHAHAEFIAARFDENYKHYKGAFARVIDYSVSYAQTLIDDFSKPDAAPHIAISVDMLDTGIDVPEVVNLVFFKLVRSKTKFWQMLGRGTRLRPDLFGPGKAKQFFYLFDYCQNLEYFSQNLPATEGTAARSMRERLFTARLELIAALDVRLVKQAAEASEWNESGLRTATALRLNEEVSAMSADNFIVRPKRKLVEHYAKPDAWMMLGADQLAELASDVAGLPSEFVDDDQDAKRFDLLILNLQLALLRSEPAFARLRKQVEDIAGVLQEQGSIPMVQAQMALILEIQTDAYWQDVTTPMLESARKRLRALMKLVEKSKRQIVYTDFEDEMGEEAIIELPGVGSSTVDFERFREKARQFLKSNQNHLSIHRLRTNEPLTASDLLELERMLLMAGVGTADQIEFAKAEASGLGLFIRSLVGLDREAAKKAFEQFLGSKTYAANQIEFVNLIVDHLTHRGVMDPALLYESPFTDLSPLGVEGLFREPQVTRLLEIIGEIRQRAAA